MQQQPRAPWWEFHLTLSYVERALRQLERAQSAHRAHIAEKERLDFTEGLVPDSIVALDVDFNDAMTFAIGAARQSLRGRQLLVERGCVLPDVRQAAAVTALRDLDEHWDKWRPKPSTKPWPNDDSWLAINAGRRWAIETGQRPDGHISYTGTDAASSRVTHWNGIDIEQPTLDLDALREVVRTFGDSAYEWEHPDDADGRELVGDEALWEKIRVWIPRFPGRDDVVRWRRSDIMRTLENVRAESGTRDP